MKAIQNFLNYVEIGTKIASVFPFLTGAGYTLYRYGSLRPKQTLIFFAAMLLFDMTTTAINNHIGYRQTGRTPHYSGPVSVAIIVCMGLAAALLGLYLVTLSDLVVLLTGLFCFGMGVIYSYGPLPISHTPYGELFSGTVMGICIPFLALQLSHPQITLALQASGRTLVFTVAWVELLTFGVVVVPLICCIANIMLANNICDLEEDVQIGRLTLPHYLGVGRSLLLYRLLYLAAYLFIVLGAALRVVSPLTLVTLFSAIPVARNIKRFGALQDKRSTFVTVIQNFLAIAVPYCACIWLGCLI